MAECVIKVIGMGIKNYFADNWNKFDFTLVMFSLLIDTALGNLRMLRNAKVGKLAKLSKIGKSQRMFKVLKVLKVCRSLRLIKYTLKTFHNVNEIFFKAIATFPSIFKMISILLIIFYEWSIVGMELFSYEGRHE